MHRWYRSEHYAERIHLIRRHSPSAAIGADVIVRLPRRKGSGVSDHGRLHRASPTYLPARFLVFSAAGHRRSSPSRARIRRARCNPPPRPVLAFTRREKGLCVSRRSVWTHRPSTHSGANWRRLDRSPHRKLPQGRSRRAAPAERMARRTPLVWRKRRVQL